MINKLEDKKTNSIYEEVDLLSIVDFLYNNIKIFIISFIIFGFVSIIFIYLYNPGFNVTKKIKFNDDLNISTDFINTKLEELEIKPLPDSSILANSLKAIIAKEKLKNIKITASKYSSKSDSRGGIITYPIEFKFMIKTLSIEKASKDIENYINSRVEQIYLFYLNELEFFLKILESKSSLISNSIKQNDDLLSNCIQATKNLAYQKELMNLLNGT